MNLGKALLKSFLLHAALLLPMFLAFEIRTVAKSSAVATLDVELSSKSGTPRVRTKPKPVRPNEIGDLKSQATQPSNLVDAGPAEAGIQASTYLEVLSAELRSMRHYPRMARLQRKEGTVVVEFSVNQDGRIENYQVIAPCDHAVLNQAALELLQAKGRVSPPPSGTQTPLRVRLPIHYILASAD